MDAIWIQIIGFVAMAFCIGSYQVKSGRGLILCKTAGDLLYVVHYLLLGSYSGCVTLGGQRGKSDRLQLPGPSKVGGLEGLALAVFRADGSHVPAGLAGQFSHLQRVCNGFHAVSKPDCLER